MNTQLNNLKVLDANDVSVIKKAKVEVNIDHDADISELMD